MAFVACRECQQEVSRVAQTCPQCRAPYPARAQWNGTGYDWKSKWTVCGYPLVHVAMGRDARGRLRVAKGVIAIGQFGIGVITIAQFGIGFLCGLGPFMLGLTAFGIVAIAPLFGLGLLATGYIAIGQLAFGYYALGQVAFGVHVWSMTQSDPVAFEFFVHILPFFGK